MRTKAKIKAYEKWLNNNICYEGLDTQQARSSIFNQEVGYLIDLALSHRNEEWLKELFEFRLELVKLQSPKECNIYGEVDIHKVIQLFDKRFTKEKTTRRPCSKGIKLKGYKL